MDEPVIDLDFEDWRKKVHQLAKIDQKFKDDVKAGKIPKNEEKRIKKEIELRWDFLAEINPTVDPSLKKGYHKLFKFPEMRPNMESK